MTLLRYQLFGTYAIAFLAIWKALLSNQEQILNMIDIPLTTPNIIRNCITFAPIILLMCLAMYALASILFTMASFRDCPEAAKEMERQVKEAKAGLKKMGVLGY